MEEMLKKLIYVLAKCEDVCSVCDFHGLNEKAGINDAIKILLKEGHMKISRAPEGECAPQYALTEKGLSLLTDIKNFTFKDY